MPVTPPPPFCDLFLSKKPTTGGKKRHDNLVSTTPPPFEKSWLRACATDILHGYKPEPNLFQTLNHFVIIAKYHIFLSWLNKASPSFKIFGLLFNEKILCERTIAFKKKNTLTKLRAIHSVHELPQISLSTSIFSTSSIIAYAAM